MAFGKGMIDCTLTYDIDDKYKRQIPLVCTNPEELHVVMQTTGTVDLPPLGGGHHCVTITVVAGVQVWGGNNPRALFKFTGINDTNYEARWLTIVYSTIDTSGNTTDSTPPVITDLTIKKTSPITFHRFHCVSTLTKTFAGNLQLKWAR